MFQVSRSSPPLAAQGGVQILGASQGTEDALVSVVDGQIVGQLQEEVHTQPLRVGRSANRQQSSVVPFFPVWCLHSVTFILKRYSSGFGGS